MEMFFIPSLNSKNFRFLIIMIATTIKPKSISATTINVQSQLHLKKFNESLISPIDIDKLPLWLSFPTNSHLSAYVLFPPPTPPLSTGALLINLFLPFQPPFTSLEASYVIRVN